MKTKSIFYITAIVLLAGFTVACKKEVEPKLIVTVVDSDGNKLKGAKVHAHPGEADQAVINEDEMDKSTSTNSSGVAEFQFKYSAVLDVDVWYRQETFIDSTLTYEYDTLIGKKVVKVEVKRQRSKDNETLETITVR